MTLTGSNRYGRLCAEVFDLNFPVGSWSDVEYYTKNLQDLDGPVLEAACGTGRLTIALLAAGIDIYGFDLSPDMLTIAHANGQARGLDLSARVKAASLQDFDYDTAFAAILVPQTTFSHLDDVKEAMATLERFRRHLRPGGRLFLDIAPPTFFQAGWPTRTRLAANGDLLVQEGRMVESDLVLQRYVSHDRYERWRDGTLVETQLERTTYRVWGAHELELALTVTGFDQIEITADFLARTAPSQQSRFLNVVARAPVS